MMAEAPEGVAQDDVSALGEVVSDNTDSVAEASHEVEEAETLETSNAEMIAQTSELADTIEEEVPLYKPYHSNPKILQRM